MRQQHSAGTSDPPQGARAATRVLDILELLARKPAGLTLSEVAAQLAVPVSSLHSLLRVLEARGYLMRPSGSRRYCLGPQVPAVSRGYLDPDEPFAAARRVMHEVAERSGETVHVAILAERDVVYVAGMASRYPLSVTSREGMRLPAHATAAGKALLATCSDDQIVALYAHVAWPKLTARTPASLHALLRELEEVRWTGYALDLEGVDTGLHCVAAVLPQEPDRPPVALSIAAPSSRLQGDGLRRLVGTFRTTPMVRGGAAPPKRRRPLLGWSLSRTRNPVYVQMRQAATEAMACLGGQILWADAPDEHKQVTDVARLLEEPLDALLIQPCTAVSAAPLFATARERDLLLVCFHRPARSRAFDFFAGGDQYRRGCLQTHAVARALGGQGGVLIVEGGSYDDNARSIAQGNRDTLALYPGLELLDSQPCEHWLPDAACVVVAEALAAHGPQRLRGVIAANDDMAIAISGVLATQGLSRQVVLVGGDGDQRALELLRSGVLAGTAFQNSAALAVTTLEYVVGVLNGTVKVAGLPRSSIFHAPEGPLVSILDVPYTWVDQTNIAVLERYWAEQASPQAIPLGATDAGP